MKTSQLVENIISELGIGTRSLAKLLDVSPTTIHRWINEEVTISNEKLNNLHEMNKTIIVLARSSSCNPDEIVKALIELKASPLWRGWDHAVQMLTGIETTIQSEDYLKKHVLQNHHLVEEDLLPIKKIPSDLDIDALFKNKKGTYIALKFYTKTVATDGYGKVKMILENMFEKLGKKNQLFLIAPDFTFNFATIADKEKNLKLLQASFTLNDKSLGNT